MLKTSIRFLLATFLLAIVAGCGPESRLVGKWVGKTGSFVFYKDKTGVVNPPAERTDLPHNVRYTWSVQGSDIVRMDMGPPVGKSIFGRLESRNVLIVEDDKFEKQ